MITFKNYIIQILRFIIKNRTKIISYIAFALSLLAFLFNKFSDNDNIMRMLTFILLIATLMLSACQLSPLREGGYSALFLFAFFLVLYIANRGWCINDLVSIDQQNYVAMVALGVSAIQSSGKSKT